MVEICAIASGSNGNCYFIGNETDAILVDAGISKRQTLERLARKGIDASKIKAIFISHEHADHLKGARVLSKKLKIPVFMTRRSLDNSWGPYRPEKVAIFNPGETINIGSLSVHTFLKKHDAAEPCSFRVEHAGVNVGVFTDIGDGCINVTSNLSLCHALFLESNHDEEMLWKGAYPHHLKVRVASDKGHLSNKQACELLVKHHHPELKVVFLSHLSHENNTPEKAISTFKGFEGRFPVKLTSRHSEAELFVLEG